MNDLTLLVRRYWAARSGREQRALRLLAVALAIALLTQGLWSLLQTRHQLRQQLPGLASAAEAMGQQVQAWQALRAGRGQSLPALIPADIDRRLGELDGTLKATWEGPAQVHVAGQVAFDAWLGCLGELQRTDRLIVVRLQAVPAGAGRITLEADLARPAQP